MMQTQRTALMAFGLLACVALLGAGCEVVPNYYAEDGPSTTMEWRSPTERDVEANYDPAEPRQREWEPRVAAYHSGAIRHLPLYMEDPFVDKGHGRTDESHPHDVYRLGWEDWVALPYCPARFTLNWLMMPVSMIVTPPCAVLESDGEVSEQLLGPDHDARVVKPRWPVEPLEPVHEPETL